MTPQSTMLRPCLDKAGNPYRDYFVAPDGGVFSNKSGRMAQRRLTIRECGYITVQLWEGGPRYEQVHVLVARAWVGMPTDPALQVNHLDGVKANNHFSNLEWTTRKGNAEHAARLGLMRHGQSHPWTTISDNEVRIIRLMASHGYTLGRLSVILGHPLKSIWSIVRGKSRVSAGGASTGNNVKQQRMCGCGKPCPRRYGDQLRYAKYCSRECLHRFNPGFKEKDRVRARGYREQQRKAVHSEQAEGGAK